MVALQQAAPISIQLWDMLLHAQQVMPPNGYIYDVQTVQTLTL